MDSSHSGRRVGWETFQQKLWNVLKSNAENQRAYRDRQKEERRQLEEEKTKEEAEGAELSRELLVEKGKSEVWRVVADSLGSSQAAQQFSQLAASQTEGFNIKY